MLMFPVSSQTRTLNTTYVRLSRLMCRHVLRARHGVPDDVATLSLEDLARIAGLEVIVKALGDCSRP